MTESELQDAVIELARLLNWRVAHFRSVRIQRADGTTHYQTPVQADGAGWPDLVLVRGRVIYAELKSAKKDPEPHQQAWLDALRHAGCEVHVWKPAQWLDGTIQKVLRAA